MYLLKINKDIIKLPRANSDLCTWTTLMDKTHEDKITFNWERK